MTWRAFIITLAVIVTISIGYGEVRYLNGWYAHSAKANADAAKKVTRANKALEPAEVKAATAQAEAAVIYRTITRDVVKYVQDPNRTRCKFDPDAVSMRQRAIDAANNIPGFDAGAVQTKPGR